MNFNFSDSVRFHELLSGKKDERFQFQTFLDEKFTKDQIGLTYIETTKIEQRKRELTKVLYGSFHENKNELVRLNRLGAGIFVCINECKPGTSRKASDVIGLRALFFELDGIHTFRQFKLTPSMVVRSKNGPHVYFCLKPGEAIDRFVGAQERLIKYFNSDPSIKDLSRVMRVPGFFHLKNPREPFLVRLEGVR